MAKMKEHDVVQLKREYIWEFGVASGFPLVIIPEGTQGTVVHVHTRHGWPSVFEVELDSKYEHNVICMAANEVELIHESNV
jgi:hypothetical protein